MKAVVAIASTRSGLGRTSGLSRWILSANRTLEEASWVEVTGNPVKHPEPQHQTIRPFLRMKWLRQPLCRQTDGVNVTAPSEAMSAVQRGLTC